MIESASRIGAGSGCGFQVAAIAGHAIGERIHLRSGGCDLGSNHRPLILATPFFVLVAAIAAVTRPTMVVIGKVYAVAVIVTPALAVVVRVAVAIIAVPRGAVGFVATSGVFRLFALALLIEFPIAPGLRLAIAFLLLLVLRSFSSESGALGLFLLLGFAFTLRLLGRASGVEAPLCLGLVFRSLLGVALPLLLCLLSFPLSNGRLTLILIPTLLFDALRFSRLRFLCLPRLPLGGFALLLLVLAFAFVLLALGLFLLTFLLARCRFALLLFPLTLRVGLRLAGLGLPRLPLSGLALLLLVLAFAFFLFPLGLFLLTFLLARRDFALLLFALTLLVGLGFARLRFALLGFAFLGLALLFAGVGFALLLLALLCRGCVGVVLLITVALTIGAQTDAGQDP